MSKEKFIRLDVKETFDYASGKTKPYYSIIYGDEDGEHRMGYSSYDLDGISSYLKVYFGVNDHLHEAVLWHCTTPKKAKLYRETGAILKPVRGFTTLQAAMAWCIHTGRTVIYEIKGRPAYKLPDHHNKFGEAWWIDEDIPINRIKAVRFDLPLHKCGEVKDCESPNELYCRAKTYLASDQCDKKTVTVNSDDSSILKEEDKNDDQRNCSD